MPDVRTGTTGAPGPVWVYRRPKLGRPAEAVARSLQRPRSRGTRLTLGFGVSWVRLGHVKLECVC
jgi:hypothetical protein